MDAPYRLAAGLLALSLALTLAVAAPPPATAADVPAPVRGPWVRGAAEAGSTLTAEPGTWEPAGVRLTYQWLADGRRIVGATSRSYSIPAFDSGTRYTVRVTASADGQSATARAKPTRATVLIPGTAPFGNRLMPAVVGRPVVGARLEADAGEWSSPPRRYLYQWLADGSKIPDATGDVFVPTSDQVGREIAVQVIARSDDGSMSRTSAATAPVTTTTPPPGGDGEVAVLDDPRLTAGPRVGRTLRVETGRIEPASAAASVQWLLDGSPLPGADGPTYTPRRRDVGGSLAARVTYTHPDREPATRTTAAALVRTRATVRARVAEAAARSARLRIRVTAPGVRPVPGRVLVRRHDGGRLARARLVEGRTVVVLRGLRAGRHSLRVVYPGSPLVVRDREVVRVVVRR
ncbi:hypothetical protein [Nocardioides ferulae]|uniref:hypothetical protein n=1 Tax=Nocardioides ferulae TaxID=2340821 RepID=UPI000EB239F4|nr:hypothetical protein [Nocardioides ferulae]